ncbi:PD-(D/E)XK nuclease family protein [Candidatus Woesearchaeota archaeon]|nr:PD-(D/E)XK nuclease family protein [Candidatus Woesearchaeota archaeon]
MAPRIQSPSSINTYKQCPRKYYYSYIEKLPTKPNIHLIRGKLVHTVLEDLFKISIEDLDNSNYNEKLKNRIQNMLVIEWKKNEQQLKRLGLYKDDLQFYFDETMLMVLNFMNNFLYRVESRIKKGESFREAFKNLTPLTEKKYISYEHKVQGFIDAIEEIDDEISLIDYKTSKTARISSEYKLQLAIYALLYNEKHKKMPHKVGVNFLKDVTHYLDVDEELLKLARFEIEQIHMSTETNEKDEYPMKPGPLCRWSTGQCDFYNHCFGKK